MNVEFLSETQSVASEAMATEWSLWAKLCEIYKININDSPYLFFGVTLAFALACIVIPYLLGSINPAIIFSKLFYHDDIRTHGSGNAGATNTLRTYGKKMSAVVLLCDMLKAALATGIGWVLMGHSVGGAMAGFFVIFGHMFPIYYKFKGGKGVACAAIVVLMMNPIVFLLCLAVFVIIVLCTRYVSLGSVVGIGLYPIFVASFDNIFASSQSTVKHNPGMIGLFAVMMAVFIIIMHRKNLVRIMNKEESKLSFKKKDKDSKDKK